MPSATLPILHCGYGRKRKLKKEETADMFSTWCLNGFTHETKWTSDCSDLKALNFKFDLLTSAHENKNQELRYMVFFL